LLANPFDCFVSVARWAIQGLDSLDATAITRNEWSTLSSSSANRSGRSKPPGYILDDQVGFILRQVYQKHALLFAEYVGDDITPTQWAVIAKLNEVGDCSQNLLGRMTAMDAATIKGVVERLIKRGYIEGSASPTDRRRLLLRLTLGGKKTFERRVAHAARVSVATLAPLKPQYRASLLRLLKQLR
jgi:MarR family transcriptional regulator, lower aerobic nicotinate degradation pathway regulator